VTQLPEIEVLRRDVEKEALGKKVKDVWLSPADLVRRHGTIKDFAAALVDTKITGVDRRGRAVLLALDSGRTLVLLPGSRARATKETATADRGELTRMVIAFSTGGALHYVDAEPDGELFVTDTELVDEVEELQGLGMDPLAEPIPWPVLSQALTERADILKAVLADDGFVVGLGDVYSDEVLFEAGLAPDRGSATLSSQEVRRLHRSILEVVYEAIKQGGADRPPADGSGGFIPYAEVDHLKVYAREGLPDARSRAIIQHTKIRKGVSSYHSSATQS
jgi:formamidopyrimidine-DNA glycosylase